jgi:glycosyltransferase involved in cell wall biosynthesis
MTKIAVVMRTYERPVLLARAIASVQLQTFTDWELVVVNNGGQPAGVDAVVRTAMNATPSGTIRVIHLSERVGMEEASNRGLADSDSEFFVIHDDDDSWDSRFLDVAIAALRESPASVAAVTGVTRIYETFRGRTVWPVSHEDFPLSQGRLTYRGMIGGNTFPPIAALFRRSVLNTVGNFDSSLPVLGDWEFNLRAVAAGDFVFIPERLAHYHTRTPDSDAVSGNSITVGEELHRDVKLQLQDRWLKEPLVNGVNKGELSITASTEILLGEIRNDGAEVRVDVEHIANRTAEIIKLQRLSRRIARSVRHPGHGIRAIGRAVRRTISK